MDALHRDENLETEKFFWTLELLFCMEDFEQVYPHDIMRCDLFTATPGRLKLFSGTRHASSLMRSVSASWPRTSKRESPRSRKRALYF